MAGEAEKRVGRKRGITLELLEGLVLHEELVQTLFVARHGGQWERVSTRFGIWPWESKTSRPRLRN